ncbi:hypothetical protein ACHK7U_06130 [Staphylococcus hominis]|uniref:hypothetical protein n=1 Tax=Staphylococcus hominis TaxID=1290 RepID=UPI000366EEB8
MMTFIYQLILFFIIIGTYALMRREYMGIEWNFLLSMYGMFVGYLVMFYFSIYTNTDFSRRTIKIISTISIILTSIILVILGYLLFILLTE